METASILLLIIQGLMGIVMYFMKIAHDATKDRLNNHSQEISDLREKTLRKEDFREFKEELRGLLNELKLDVKEALAKKT